MPKTNIDKAYLRSGEHEQISNEPWVRSKRMKVAANNRQGRRIPQLSGLCVLLAAMTGCQHDAQIPAKTLVPVHLAEVTVYASAEGLRYSASLVPFAQVDVAFRTTGYVTDVKQIKPADSRIRNVGVGD